MLSTFDEARLFGARHGDDPPRVLALHGWARTHADFDAMFGDAIDGIALDLPGFGATPAPPEPWGSEEYAKAVLPVLESFDEPPVVVGHSFGGRVAVHLAASFPERVRALVLTGAPLHRLPGSGRKPRLRYRVVRALAKAHLVSEERLERARRRHGSTDYRQAEGVMRPILVRTLQEDYEEPISRLTCPVELVWGDDDTAAPLPVAEWLHDHIAGADLVICPGAGHLTPISVPDQLRAAVERQLR